MVTYILCAILWSWTILRFGRSADWDGTDGKVNVDERAIIRALCTLLMAPTSPAS